MNGMNFFDADEKLIHYEGELGIFDYDPEEFEVRYFWGKCIFIIVERESLLIYLKVVQVPDLCLMSASYRQVSLLDQISILARLQIWFTCLKIVNCQQVFLLEIDLIQARL